jgi:hypothetical protein
VYDEIQDLMTTGCETPGPSLSKFKRSNGVQVIYLHDKRGFRTKSENRNYDNLIHLITDNATKLGIKYNKV